MTDSARRDSVNGACLCGAIQFEIATPVEFCAHCHCHMCQRAHGAGVVTWIGVKRERFKLLTGSLARYRSSDHGTRSFCPTCGSSLFCESTKHPDVIDVVLANVRGSVGVDPKMHVHHASKAPWIELADDLPRIDG